MVVPFSFSSPPARMGLTGTSHVRGEVTKLGQLLDPICDKVLGTAVFTVLVYRSLLPR